METTEIKYPEITVELVGKDGNAFHVLGLVRKALKQGGVSKEEIKLFTDEAMSGDYDHLLQICIKWIVVT